MELPKPKTRNIMTYFNQFARGHAPEGSNQHHQSISRGWRERKPKSDPGAVFSLSGSCEGKLEDVLALGLRMAQDAIETGNVSFAEEIIARIETVKVEYEIAEKEAELKRLELQVAKVAEAQAIVAKRK